MRLNVAMLSDVGRIRETNEDASSMFLGSKYPNHRSRGDIFVVSDGMGGASAGEIASSMATKIIIDAYYQNSQPAKSVEDILCDAVCKANSEIFRLSQDKCELKGMGCTVTAAVFVKNRVVIANVGDSRAYRIRKNEILQITEDHSWIAEQIKNNVISLDQAKTHPYRNVITRALGTNDIVQPDLFSHKIARDDVYLLCSDGLHGLVSDNEIANTIAAHNLKIACRRLIDIANERGGSDNITALLVKVGKTGKFAFEQDNTIKISTEVPRIISLFNALQDAFRNRRIARNAK